MTFEVSSSTSHPSSFVQRSITQAPPQRLQGLPRQIASRVLVIGILALPCFAQAQQTSSQIVPAQPSGVLSLEAHASAEVPVDVIRIQMFYEEQGKDPGALADALKSRTSVALKTAKGQDVVKVKTGSFSITPSTDRDGKISGWRGRSELELESQDFTAASQLAGQLSGNGKLQVGGIQFSLSPQALQKAETSLTKQAIASFREQASSSAKAFGYTDATVREVNVGAAGPMQSRMSYRMMMASPAMAKVDTAVPIEAGTTTVTVNVSGSVQMTR